MKTVEYLSFGGGPPSVALLVLNAWGEVHPKAQLVVMADTGWEKQETYRLLPTYQNWCAEMNMEFVIVQAKEGPLPDYIHDRSVVIPAFSKIGKGYRQCTRNWKVRPIEQYLRQRFGRRGLQITAQLAMTYDEAYRIKDSPEASVTNRWPLIEKRLKRDATVEIVKMAGLPVPPWSACLGCPLQNDGNWRTVAASFPDDFAQAVKMDEFLRERAAQKGKPPLWLHSSRRPLSHIYSPTQKTLPMLTEENEGVCESGHCFT